MTIKFDGSTIDAIADFGIQLADLAHKLNIHWETLEIGA